MERQVMEAALAVVRPATPPDARAHASSSLEAWTRTDDATTWETYASLLALLYFSGGGPLAGGQQSLPPDARHAGGAGGGGGNAGRTFAGTAVERIAAETAAASSSSSSSSQAPMAAAAAARNDAAGVRLLLLTMLHSKIRREYGRDGTFLASGVGGTELAVRIRDGVGAAMMAAAAAAAAMGRIRREETGNGGDASLPSLSSVAAEMTQLCSCAGAIAVRTSGGMGDLVGSAHAALAGNGSNGAVVATTTMTKTTTATATKTKTTGLSPSAALRVLSCLPEEADAAERTAKELDAEMAECVPAVLDAVGSALVKPLSSSENSDLNADVSFGLCEADAVLALKVLGNWIQRCRITLSQLSAVRAGTDDSLLAVLVAILSQPHPTSSAIIVAASSALSGAVANPPDGGSDGRRAAVAVLLESIPRRGFLVAPFARASAPASSSLSSASADDWEGAAHSIAALAGELACEEMDSVALCRLPGCSDLIELLLRITSHPSRSVAAQALEAWLTLQDVPASERHPDAASPLYRRIVDVLIPRVAYADSFVSWDDEDETDPQDFAEMRSLVSDVLVSAYFLLRAHYVDRIAASIRAEPGRWAATESALFALTAPSREICARVKARAGGASVAADKEATASLLVRLASELCAGGADAAAMRHGLVLSTVASFLGSFAPVWNVCCTPEGLLDMLAYLRDAMKHPTAAAAAAKSTRQILVGCCGKLSAAAEQQAPSSGGGDIAASNPVAASLAMAMQSALAAGGEEGMKLVAEGGTRLCMQMKDVELSRRVLCLTLAPVLMGLQQALEAVRSVGDGTVAAAVHMEMSCQGVATCLRVVREVVRFCDEPSPNSDSNYPLTDVLNILWPTLNDIVSNPVCRRHESILTELLNVHGQLLSNAKALVAPHFSGLVNFVVQSFEETHLPCALDYVATAVEAFGGEGIDAEQSFRQLLSHLSQCAFAYVTQEKRPNECPEVITAFFEMTQRYLLFCSQALVACSDFGNLFSFAVACLEECKGERESTRATLKFLAQIIGWKTLRLSLAANAALEAATGVVDALVIQHGEVVTKGCILALSGGAPQMLWPAYSDCLFAVITYALGCSLSPVNGEGLAHHWMTSALSDGSVLRNGVSMTSETKAAVTYFLFGLAKEGPKSKPRAKMLLGDFGKICKGEATPDVLVAYSLE